MTPRLCRPLFPWDELADSPSLQTIHSRATLLAPGSAAAANAPIGPNNASALVSGCVPPSALRQPKVGTANRGGTLPGTPGINRAAFFGKLGAFSAAADPGTRPEVADPR